MKKESALPIGVGLGISIGAAIGVATGDIAIWLPLGLSIGAALGVVGMSAGSDSDEDNTDEAEEAPKE
ncbi:MAG: hypothetical protein AAFR82_09845 [Pseudomonadota bacterium]